MLNNARMRRYQLKGIKKKISQKVFALTANMMDIFINNIRIEPRLIDIMTNSTGELSILGILQIDEISRAKLVSRRLRRIRPLMLIPGISDNDLQYVEAFETHNERQQIKRLGLPGYRALKPEEARVHGLTRLDHQTHNVPDAAGPNRINDRKEYHYD